MGPVDASYHLPPPTSSYLLPDLVIGWPGIHPVVKGRRQPTRPERDPVHPDPNNDKQTQYSSMVKSRTTNGCHVRLCVVEGSSLTANTAQPAASRTRGGDAAAATGFVLPAPPGGHAHIPYPPSARACTRAVSESP